MTETRLLPTDILLVNGVILKVDFLNTNLIRKKMY